MKGVFSLGNWDSWRKQEEERKKKIAWNKECWHQAALEKQKQKKAEEQNIFSAPSIPVIKPEIKSEKTGKIFPVHLNKKDFEDITVSPFAENNPFGFLVNVSHPAIFPIFHDYKNFVNERIILTYERRQVFEKCILSELNRIGVRKTDYPEKPKLKIWL